MPTITLPPESRLTWAILFHLLGIRERSSNELAELASGSSPIREISASILAYETLSDNPKGKSWDQWHELSSDGSTIMLTSDQQARIIQLMDTLRVQLGPSHALLNEIVHSIEPFLALDELDGMRLGWEPLRCEDSGVSGDSPRQGISRDPYKTTRTVEFSSQALAAALYLLRGYALFFCRPALDRSYNTARMALNDFFQAYQLAWRLYQTRDRELYHHEQSGLSTYYEEIGREAIAHVNNPNSVQEPAESAYFSWAMLMLVDVFRANVYRHLNYLEQANRDYSKSLHRLLALAPTLSPARTALSNPSPALPMSLFAVPTMCRAVAELGLVRFDLGNFVDGLRFSMQALYMMCVRSFATRTTLLPADEDLLKTMRAILAILEAERHLPVFDRILISRLFGAPFLVDASESSSSPAPQHAFSPEELGRALHAPPDQQLAISILARIGHILMTIRPRFEEDDQITTQWLERYLSAHEHPSIEGYETLKGRASDLGRYTRGIIAPQNPQSGQVKSGFSDHIEREFAHSLRSGTLGWLDQQGREATRFYSSVMRDLTDNVQNFVTTPQRTRKTLMRRGYITRKLRSMQPQNSVYKTLMQSMAMGHPYGQTPLEYGQVVVLRRWQSYNPKVPQPMRQELRGGGYLLIWNGRGIAIDPGFDFVRNLYDEGYSLEDIDAVLVTHCHPDHDDELIALTSLLREWNEFHEQCGETRMTKRWDFFLSTSAMAKHYAWLRASSLDIGRIVPLSADVWDTIRKDPRTYPAHGENDVKDLRYLSPRPYAAGSEPIQARGSYSMKLEVVPAWHRDVIGKTDAIGVKFHLYRPAIGDSPTEELVCTVGYTGDTGAYGILPGSDLELAPAHPQSRRIDLMYRDCDVLIAHLGDIRLRELTTMMQPANVSTEPNAARAMPLLAMFRQWILPSDSGPTHTISPDRIREFMYFANWLDLVPQAALRTEVSLDDNTTVTIAEWLGDFIDRSDNLALPKSLKDSDHGKESLAHTLEHLIKQDTLATHDLHHEWCLAVTKYFSFVVERINADMMVTEKLTDQTLRCVAAAQLVAFLSASSALPWQYQTHLGVYGLLALFMAMATQASQEPSSDRGPLDRVLIVGELPEELASYRHKIAMALNEHAKRRGLPIRAFTGDLGLVLKMNSRCRADIQVQCTYCDHNNELVVADQNAKPVAEITEVMIKRLDAALIYLCTHHDHFPESVDGYPVHCLSHPSIRVV